MRQAINLLLLLYISSHFAQTKISGIVLDSKKQPIIGANVYLDGTYDGTATNEKGEFVFHTEEENVQTLVVSFLSFETYTKTADVSRFQKLSITLKADINTLDTVVITAGLFEAGEKAKVTVLKPLDIVTTASAVGDFLGAIQTLPGTATVAEDGRLFVRGGDANETQIFIDGMRVFTPYVPTARNIPTRGRYSPFLFKGISFSTGGYSAEYGQALSSVLALNTIDYPDQEKTEVQVMSVGAGVGNTQMWGKSSFSINTSYINLAPYLELYPDRNTWNKPYQAMNGEMVFRHTFEDDSLLKVYGAFSYTDFNLIQQDINFTNGFEFGLQNRNFYLNSSYRTKFGNNWRLETGISYTHDNTKVDFINDDIKNNEDSAHLKIKLNKNITNRVKINFGAEYFLTDFDERFLPHQGNTIAYGFNNNILASFVESDIYFSKDIGAKIGLRSEYSELFQEHNLSPRASLSIKSSKNAQFSVAYGEFFQNPGNDFLKFEQNLNPERTTHYIANFQWTRKDEIFRIEGYYKKYIDLVKFDTEMPNFMANYSNDGYGYAKGIDIFWRQNQKIKNTDYWISYSYLDTQRDFRNFPVAATPNFASKHNFSVVAKHWVEDWKSQIGFAYNFATGRTFTNPNEAGFLNNQSPNYNSLSLNWAYLIDQQKILYFSVNNALFTKNILGYNYANTANTNGFFEREAILPNADSFFFIGFFWTISDDNKSNQLNNL